MLAQLCALLGADAAILWEVDERTRLLRHGCGWSRPGEALEAFLTISARLTFAPGVGLPGRAWVGDGPVVVDDVGRDENFPREEAARRAGLRAGVAVAAGTLAVVELLGARAPAPAQLDLLDTAGRQLGQYLARVSAEERLRTTEERTAAIVRAALDCIVTMDHAGRVVDFNPAAEATFGYTREEAIGREVADLIVPPDLRDAHREALARHLRTGETTILNRRIELTGMRADGWTLPIELTVTRLGQAEPPLFAGFVRDITERRRSAVAVADALEREHASRLRAEAAERSARRVAEALQRSLLPPHLPEIAGAELAAAYRPGTAGSLVGGDFYDVFPIDEGCWGIAIGDVRGKGADAAALTALVRYTLRAAAVREARPSAALAAVNAALLADTDAEDFCTAAFGRLEHRADGLRVRFAVGGHPLPLVVRGDGAVETVGRPGGLLGAVAAPALHDAEVLLAPGDVLLLYTDGVIESPAPGGGRLGTEGLRALLSEAAGAAALVTRRIEDAVGPHAADDLAVLAVCARTG